MKLSNTNKKLQAFLLEQATYQNSYAAYIPWSSSIGFKVNSMRMQKMDGKYQLINDFLANLGFTRNDMESEASIRSFLEPSGTVMLSYANREDNSHLEKVFLPTSVPLKMSFDAVTKNRRSIRQFTGDKIPLVYLATVLRKACGVTDSKKMDLNNGASVTLDFRATPSAGGIYPVDLYIAALHIEKLDRAVYQYNPSEDCLVKIGNQESVDNLMQSFSITDDHISISRAGFICLLIGSAAKSTQKYGNQGLSFTLQEIGSISQNIHLSVTALGVGGVDCASFYQQEAHQALKIDGIYKHLFHTIVVGVSK